MVSDRAFIFNIYIPLGITLSLVSKSKSSVKVKIKYQGHSFQKNSRCGGTCVSQTYLVSFCHDFFAFPTCFEKHSPYGFDTIMSLFEIDIFTEEATLYKGKLPYVLLLLAFGIDIIKKKKMQHSGRIPFATPSIPNVL